MRVVLATGLCGLLVFGCSDSGSELAGSGGVAAPTSSGTGGSIGGAGGSVVGGGGSGGDATGGAGGAAGGAGGGGVEDPGTMTSDARLYSTDGTAFLIDEIGEALTHAASTGPVDNLIYYVHGRGCSDPPEPEKSLNGCMPELESDYSARVVMFNWPGSDVGCPLGYPETQARASGLAFAHTLRRLAYFKWQNPTALASHKLTLITHSMGNMVFEQAVLDDTSPLPSSLFHTLMVGSAAVARDGHQGWLSQVTFAPHVYVSGNKDDAMLLAASIIAGRRLGQDVEGTTLASNALYVDFTALAVNHDYYIHSSQDGAAMMAFYDAVMNGLPFDFESAAGIASVEDRDGTHVYHFAGP